MKCTKCGSKRIKVNKEQFVCKKCGEVLDWSQDEKGNIVDSQGNIIVKKKSPLAETLEFCYPIVIAVVLAVLLKTLVFANAVVPTSSMINTIDPKDRLIASRLAYTFCEPERYDIAIFEFPDNEDEYFVKRVIGLPGETVNIVDGIVYVTSPDKSQTIQLDDSFVTACVPFGTYGPYEVPENSYFMLGDNRNDSLDSRFWSTTNYVRDDQLIGKVVFKYYPNFEKLD